MRERMGRGRRDRGWPRDWDGSPGEEQGRFGRRRRFDGAGLRLLLLDLIRQEPRHGYDLIRAVEELSGGAYTPSPGLVYPTLTLLKDQGHVTEAEAEQRRLYTISAAGSEHLAQHADQVAALRAQLAALAAVRDRTEAAPVRRAMHNLKTALVDKLSAGADREQVLKIVALIDEAAQKIERL